MSRAPIEPATAADTLKRLRAAFETGRTRPIGWRRSQLRRLEARLVERETELLDALAADLAKPAIEGYLTEVAFTRAEIEHTLAHLESWMDPERVAVPLTQQPARARIVREPLGVVLVIGPWNRLACALVVLVARRAGRAGEQQQGQEQAVSHGPDPSPRRLTGR